MVFSNGKRSAGGGGERMPSPRQAIVRPYLLLVTTFVVSTILLKDSGHILWLFSSQLSEYHTVLFDLPIQAEKSPESRRMSEDTTAKAAVMIMEGAMADPHNTAGANSESAPNTKGEKQRSDTDTTTTTTPIPIRTKKSTLADHHVRSGADTVSKPPLNSKEIQDGTNDKSGSDNEMPSTVDSKRGINEQNESAIINKGKSQVVEPETTKPVKCSPWGTNIDDFWQDHPDWEPTVENETHTCFEPIQDPVKASFLRRLHKQQFPVNEQECERVGVSHVANFGFGSHFQTILADAFYSVNQQQKPYQITRINPNYRWMYTPFYNKDRPEQNSWAACPSQDNFCYFLPISNCTVEPGHPAERRKPRYMKPVWYDKNETAITQRSWMIDYIMRPRQEVRRRLRLLVEEMAPKLPSAPSCTWIHVRRGDAMTEEGMLRNFYPIELYIQRGKIGKNDKGLLLMTDDEAAIEEALLLHPEYDWKFFNKTRNRGVQDIHAHFPTKDEAFETLTILAEMTVASRCKKGVFGSSKFPLLITHEMAKKHAKEDITKIQMDTGIRRTPTDAREFMKDLEARLAQARLAMPASK